MASQTIAWQFSGRPILDPAPVLEYFRDNHLAVPDELAQCNRFTRNRGCAPSVGRVLMTRADILAIGNIESHSHALEIRDGATKIKIETLAIVQTCALIPFARAFETGDETPYVCTIADARESANLTSLCQGFNRVPFIRNVIESTSQPLTAKQIALQIWDEISGQFGGQAR